MSGTPVSPDPYPNSRFRVKWDGRYVASVSKVSALRRSTEVLLTRDGGDPGPGRKSPGQTEFDAITLERGRTSDTAFEEWANQVWSFTAATGTAFPLLDARKDLILELYNEAGQLVLAYKIYRCWVSEYIALSDLDGSASAVSFESIRIENEGWERDAAVVPPQP